MTQISLLRDRETTIAHDRIIVVLDIGTSKVSTLIANVSEEEPEILGIGVCPAQGVEKGIVTDDAAAAASIAASLRRAEQQSGFKAISAFVGVAGAHCRSWNSRAVVDVARPDHVVTDQDIRRAVASARVVDLPAQEEILHVLPHRFDVDDLTNLPQPIGLVGRRLAVDAVLVTGGVTALHRLTRCVESVGVELDALVFSPLAESYAILTDAERDLGSLLIDIGGGTTDAAIFREGGLVHACGLPVGGYQLSNDLAFGLRVPLELADSIKLLYGSTMSRARGEGEAVPLQPINGDPDLWVEQCIVAEILDARLTETFEMIHHNLSAQGFGNSYQAGIVLTGGSVRIPGIAELATQVFEVPARIGVPGQVQGIADSVHDPSYSASIGLLMWGGIQLRAATAAARGSRIARIGLAIQQWLRNFLG